ncbi:MarR family winged helix-turn-helix transcriptional regulator [Cryobacterium sp. Hb1]|uniref:MarR family winged helix-turn-helix transcriptional regulator n=1 Tax=Cryobacterium sp. Hb1 TaxID=1259147 RepID=UPI00106955E0|nr:MarR family transcriptional regulator [Cryobacterium sp. Hb1]TFD69152.1 MarR family transcriptional regulator [Cryobacterium sp. Hb1]
MKLDISRRPGDGLCVSALAFLRGMDRNRNRVAAETNLTGSELRALARVAEAGSITPKLLAESMEITTGAVTAISNRLVALELVTRVAHPHDRRSLLLVLTPAAEQITQKLYSDFAALIARAARDVSPDDQVRLGELLTSMALVVDADADLIQAGSTR